MEGDDNNSLIWFVSGAAIGAVLALLFAPESGDRTRRRLARHARRGSDALRESGRDLYDKGRDLYDKGRGIAEDAAEMLERGRRLAEKKIDEAV